MTTYPGQITVTRENNYHIRLGVVYDDAGGIKYAGARKIVFRPKMWHIHYGHMLLLVIYNRLTGWYMW